MNKIVITALIETDAGKAKIEFDSSTQIIKMEGASYPLPLKAVMDLQERMKDQFRAHPPSTK